MRLKFLIVIALLLASVQMRAIEIERWVSIGGTGDGTTPEAPTSDLGAVLDMSFKVDKLTVHVVPGFYTINVPRDGSEKVFPNVYLDGTWKQEGYEKVRINSWVAFTGSFVQNVSSAGNLTMRGGVLVDCESDKTISTIYNTDDVYMTDCRAKSFWAESWTGSRPSLTMVRCHALDGGYGLQAKGLDNVNCIKCEFSNQEEGGVNIDNCMFVTFRSCEFTDNKGDGAVRVTCFDRKAYTGFTECQFLDNKVTNNHSHNFLITTETRFFDCLFAGNTEKSYDHKGFVHLSRPDFQFINCTFIDNSGAIEAEAANTDDSAVINCAFWNSGSDMVSLPNGGAVNFGNNATNHGSGIPELDRENGIILLTESNKGFTYRRGALGAELELEPSSVLVNKGRNRGFNTTDIFSQARTVFGGTDIGCREMVWGEGLWTPTDQTLTVDNCEFVMCKATVGGTDYYALVSPSKIEDGRVTEFGNLGSIFWIYLDTMPVAPKVHDGKYLERTVKTASGEYEIDVIGFNQVWYWIILDSTTYSSAKERPTVKITDSGIQFIKPAAPAKPAAAGARKSATSSKSTPARRPGGRVTPRR